MRALRAQPVRLCSVITRCTVAMTLLRRGTKILMLAPLVSAASGLSADPEGPALFRLPGSFKRTPGSFKRIPGSFKRTPGSFSYLKAVRLDIFGLVFQRFSAEIDPMDPGVL